MNPCQNLLRVEFADLRSKISTAKFAMTSVTPKAFTEKGLYMMGHHIKAFSKIRELSRGIRELSVVQDKAEQKSLMHKSGELIAEIFDDDLQTSGAETSIELNFAVLKFRHTIKKKNK